MTQEEQMIVAGITPEFLDKCRARYDANVGKYDLSVQFHIVTHPKNPHILYDIAAMMILKERCAQIKEGEPLVNICDLGLEHLNKILADKQAEIKQAEEIGDGLVKKRVDK